MVHTLSSPLSNEMSGAFLGDKRLNERLEFIVDSLSARPSVGFPEVFDSDAKLEATYRFLNNDRVTPQLILAPHLQATLERARDQGSVLVVHDSTAFVFTGEADREGLQRMSRTKQAIWGHFALCVGRDSGEPLGVAGVHTYINPVSKSKQSSAERKMVTQREPSKWWRLVEEVEERCGKQVQNIHVMDREADSYELFGRMHQKQYRYVVRLYCNRKLVSDNGEQETEKLFETLGRTGVVVEREVPISRRAKANGVRTQKYYPVRESRVARLCFSAAQLNVARPATGRSHLPKQLALNLVLVKEINGPEGLEPVEWKIATSEPIDTVDQIT